MTGDNPPHDVWLQSREGPETKSFLKSKMIFKGSNLSAVILTNYPKEQQ